MLPFRNTAAVQFATPGNSLVTVEYFVDFTCPFSAKMFGVIDALLQSHTIAAPVGVGIQILMHQVPQPWHPQSAIVHEAALAVKKIAQDKYFEFCRLLFREQANFFDKVVWNITRPQLVAKLVKLADLDAEKSKEMESLLGENLVAKEKGESNYGSNIVVLLKEIVRVHRIRGVHVTPTVFINGFEAKDVSSSWAIAEWISLLNSFGLQVQTI